MTDGLLQWIWLPEERWPDSQRTAFSKFSEPGGYAVAEFKKEYRFPQKVTRAALCYSGDTVFQLFCNGGLVSTGPACAEGDFIENREPPANFYAFRKEIEPDAVTLSFFARVQMSPTQLFHFSKGRGGFALRADLTFEDGTAASVSTDGSWLARQNRAYCAPDRFEGGRAEDPFVPAQITADVWQAKEAPIPPCEEREIVPEGSALEFAPGEEGEAVLWLDKIYAGFLRVKAKTRGEFCCEIVCRELEEEQRGITLTFRGEGEYRGFDLLSAGNLRIRGKNSSAEPARIEVSFLTSNYPVSETAAVGTDDQELNEILEVCRHTLKYCRQTQHLDSPRHCEPLACTGDYYVESLMTPFSFGDMRLAEFDVLRTAELLTRHDGRMFHTTYSLIWVRMLFDVYMAAGHAELPARCLPALRLLLKRFDSYLGPNGLLETPPDYMFVDWICVDGFSLHHPPKALGQTCLNLFYFQALDCARKLFLLAGEPEEGALCLEKREALRRAVNALLFDPRKGCYCEGLNTPTEARLLGPYMPQNTSKPYFRKHANILAACFGVCEDGLAAALVDRILSDEIEGEVQPYFLHFLLEAVFRLDKREQYTLNILRRWADPVRACPKGLVEGFVPPEPGYSFDHSHAWGGTPLYALPKALMGLEILSPGMRRIRLSPSLLGLRQARAELLTPFGKVVCEMERSRPPRITHSEQVTIAD